MLSHLIILFLGAILSLTSSIYLLVNWLKVRMQQELVHHNCKYCQEEFLRFLDQSTYPEDRNLS